jgi:hypothetical protein
MLMIGPLVVQAERWRRHADAAAPAPHPEAAA